MKRIMVAGFFLILLCGGCQGLQRGFIESVFVSEKDPQIQVHVKDLPLKTAGFTNVRLDGTNNVAGLPVDLWLAVYGAENPQSSMAIIAHAQLPESWEWDHDSTPPFSRNVGAVAINNTTFQTCTYIAESQRDAFFSVCGAEKGSVRWIVRRYASRSAFGREKLTFEYREILSSDEKARQVIDLPFKFVSDFEQRASSVFACEQYSPKKDCMQKTPIQGIELKYLGKNLLGTASAKTIWPNL